VKQTERPLKGSQSSRRTIVGEAVSSIFDIKLSEFILFSLNFITASNAVSVRLMTRTSCRLVMVAAFNRTGHRECVVAALNLASKFNENRRPCGCLNRHLRLDSKYRKAFDFDDAAHRYSHLDLFWFSVRSGVNKNRARLGGNEGRGTGSSKIEFKRRARRHDDVYFLHQIDGRRILVLP
jgi:hypothetical protein